MADMREKADEPAAATDDAGSMQAVPIPDKIAAEVFEAERDAKKASKSVWAGCRRAKAVMPSASGD